MRQSINLRISLLLTCDSYEDLIAKISSFAPPIGNAKAFNEDTLLTNAEYITDQVASYDDGNTGDEFFLMTSPAMQYLKKLAGVSVSGRKSLRERSMKRS